MFSVKSANLLTHQAMWFCSFPFGIAHHSAKSSRVLISGCGVFIIRMIGALVRGISSLRHCFAAFAFTSWYWNTSFRAFVHKIWKAASCQFDCRYDCLRSNLAPCGNSELTFRTLPSWRIWSEKLFRWWNFTNLTSNSSTRCVQFLFRSASHLHQFDDALQPEKDFSKWGHPPVPPVCPKSAAFSKLLRPPLYIYWRGIDWKHPCDNETPPDNSPCTRSWPQYGTSTVP